MRFLVDECTGPKVASVLLGLGHDVFSVYEQARGLDDDSIIKKAYTENRILITNDKDFGEKVFKEKLPHHGVIFLRLSDERAKIKISVIQQLLEQYGDHLAEEFVVATESRIRIAGIS